MSVFSRVAAVVHHGGAGTTTAAARAGVPQVVLPHILDQYYWAHRVQQLGLGPRGLPVELVTADILADRIDAAVNDAGIAPARGRVRTDDGRKKRRVRRRRRARGPCGLGRTEGLP